MPLTLDHLLPILLIEIAVIVGVSRIIGYAFARFKQPQVVGEMVAGIALGPSLLGAMSDALVNWGWIAKEHHPAQLLFPSESVIFLGVLAQLGVILFLFLVGLELDPKLLRNKGHAAVVISHASIVVPFLLGLALTLFLYPRLFNDTPTMRFTPVALFMGAAMSITAFPVLARILTERNLHKTKIGAITITCAAVDDVTAWCMLAFVVGVARAEGIQPALMTAGFSTLYVLGMFFVVRPFLARLQAVHDRQGQLNMGAMALVLGLVLLSAWTTEKIGIHALFGAFLMGAIMPKGTQFVRTVTEKLEDVVVVLLLPIFFAFTGLKTQIGLLNTPELWGYTGLIVLTACLGKFGGSAVAGRACGFTWREASVVGTLMNTRGLMELVILNIGLGLGVITPAVFAMMVIMALATTAMTAPVLHYLYPLRIYAAEVGAALGIAKKSRKKSSAPSVLIPVADPRTGATLVQLADRLTARPPAAAKPPAATPQEALADRQTRLGLASDDGRKIYALHLRRPIEKDAYHAVSQEASSEVVRQPEVSLQPLLEQAEMRDIPVEVISFVSRDIANDIVRTAADRDVDLVLMGSHRAVVGRTVLGGAVHQVLNEVSADVAVYVDRGLADGGQAQLGRVLVPYLKGRNDRLALELAARLGRSPGTRVTVLHVVQDESATDSMEPAVSGKSAVEAAIQALKSPPADLTRALSGEADAEPARRIFADPTMSSGVEFRVVRGRSPIDALLQEGNGFDLMIVGLGENWGLESQLFGFKPERLVAESNCSLLLVRKGEASQSSGGVEPGEVASLVSTEKGA